MSSWQEVVEADELFCDLREMDISDSASGFNVEMAVARIGARSIHVLWGQNLLTRNVPEWKQHLSDYPDGIVMKALQETIRILVDEVGGYRNDDLLIQYGIHDIS